MNQLPILRSLKDLHHYLKTFLAKHPQAAELSGSSREHPDDGQAVAYVWIDSQQAWYAINSNTKRTALTRFIQVYEAAPAHDKETVLVPSRADKPRSSMIIAGGTRASGWYCFYAEHVPHECQKLVAELAAQPRAA